MNAMRMTLLTISAMTFLGIWLTGFERAHWVLYLPAGFLAFAGITGVCPGVIIWSKMGLKNEALACEFSPKKRG